MCPHVKDVPFGRQANFFQKKILLRWQSPLLRRHPAAFRAGRLMFVFDENYSFLFPCLMLLPSHLSRGTPKKAATACPETFRNFATKNLPFSEKRQIPREQNNGLLSIVSTQNPLAVAKKEEAEGLVDIARFKE